MLIEDDALRGSSVSRVLGAEGHPQDLLGARSPPAALGAADGAVEVPGAVDAGADAGGADEVVAPPHAATMTAMLARMPKSRFCMDSPPNG